MKAFQKRHVLSGYNDKNTLKKFKKLYINVRKCTGFIPYLQTAGKFLFFFPIKVFNLTDPHEYDEPVAYL